MSKLHDDQCSSLILYHSPWLALVGNPRPNGLQATVDFFFRPIHRVAVVYGSRCYWKTAGWCGEDLQQLAYHIYLVKVRCSCFCHAILI